MVQVILPEIALLKLPGRAYFYIILVQPSCWGSIDREFLDGARSQRQRSRAMQLNIGRFETCSDAPGGRPDLTSMSASSCAGVRTSRIVRRRSFGESHIVRVSKRPKPLRQVAMAGVSRYQSGSLGGQFSVMSRLPSIPWA